MSDTAVMVSEPLVTSPDLPIHPIPEIQTHNKLSTEVVVKQINECLSYHYPDFAPLSRGELGREAIVICGGPTVDGLVEKIKSLRMGRVVIAVDRMQEWCWGHGIIPDYVLAMDGSGDFVADSFKKTNPYTTYIIATQCGGKVAQALVGARTYIISSVHENVDLKSHYTANGYPMFTTLNGGSNVGLTAILMSTVMGMRGIHLFGYDCHRGDNEEGYAKGVTGGYPGVQHVPENNFEAICEGRVFKTTHAYWAGAQQFFVLMNFLLKNKGIDGIKVYGDSAVIALCNPDYREWLRGDCTVPPQQNVPTSTLPLIGA